MDLDWSSILQITVPTGAMIAWAWSRLDKKFDAVDKKFDYMEKRFQSIDNKFESLQNSLDKKFESIWLEIKEIRLDLTRLNIKVERLEIRFEERNPKKEPVTIDITDQVVEKMLSGMIKALESKKEVEK